MECFGNGIEERTRENKREQERTRENKREQERKYYFIDFSHFIFY
jgi:hypothetical protein